METPQLSEVSVSGSIDIQGHLTSPSGPSDSSSPVQPPSSLWRFWNQKDFHNRLIAYATLLLAFVTGALALVAFCSLLDVRAAVSDGKKAFQLSERAFVVPSLEIRYPGPSQDIPLLISPFFKNEGNTQTVEMAYWPEANGLTEQRWDSVGAVYPPRLDPKNVTRNKLWLGPKQGLSIEGLSVLIRAQDLANYLANPAKYWLLYIGTLQYYDVFRDQGTKLHTQKFCYVIWNNPTVIGTGKFAASQCASGGNENCTDTECGN
jgi:hypothetical protein